MIILLREQRECSGAAVPWPVGRTFLSRPMQAYLGNQLAPQTFGQMAPSLVMSQLINASTAGDRRPLVRAVFGGR
jgi:hypothetical protein